MVTANIQKNMGNLGWITIVIAIIGLVADLVQKGYPYYSALKTAKAMQKEQKILTEKENIELAQALTQQHPQLTYDDWIELVKATNLIYPPITTCPEDAVLVNDACMCPTGTTLDVASQKCVAAKKLTDYWIYLAIFVGIMVVTKKI
jgi:hypothetical protein